MGAPATRAEPAFTVELEQPADAVAIEALIARAFGPGRFAKTAERLREHSAPIEGLCFVTRAEGVLTGSVRLWPVVIGEEAGAFLGPIAVDAAARDHGLGAALVEASCRAAEAHGLPWVLLVGDPPYFNRFGFERAAVTLPGPVDARRVLVRTLTGSPAPAGAVRRP
jgi:predicted N-acetyltransferase YhbS